MASFVSFELTGKVAVLRMDDGKANALSDQMITELDEALDRACKEASAVVLAGRPERFCAGFDLRAMMAGPASARALLVRGAKLYTKLYGLPVPLVIACTGHALAGGALVMLTGDLRLVSAGAYRIGLNEVAIGLPVPVLAQALARDRLTPGELSRATLLARIYTPEEAVRAGYADEVVPVDEVLARAQAEAGKLAELSRQAFHATKLRLRGATIAHIENTLESDLRGLMPGG